jgi:hypothetical protein
MKPKTWAFWVPAMTSVGTAKYIKFVRKSDYDKLAKELIELKKALESK